MLLFCVRNICANQGANVAKTCSNIRGKKIKPCREFKKVRVVDLLKKLSSKTRASFFYIKTGKNLAYPTTTLHLLRKFAS
jgi:hypothetical protein